MEHHITFIETSAFTKRITELISDDDFAEFETDLAQSESDNLTADEKKQLKKIVDAIKRECQK